MGENMSYCISTVHLSNSQTGPIFTKIVLTSFMVFVLHFFACRCVCTKAYPQDNKLQAVYSTPLTFKVLSLSSIFPFRLEM